MTRRKSLSARVDLPPLDSCGPWPPRPNPHLDPPGPKNRSQVVLEMQLQRTVPRAARAEQLVPEAVRLAYAALWHEQQQDLEYAERRSAAYRWRAIFRRLVDRIAGPPRIQRPEPGPNPFRG